MMNDWISSLMAARRAVRGTRADWVRSFGDGSAPASSLAPQPPQNCSPTRLKNAQRGHGQPRTTPQWPQNRRSSRFVVVQYGHCMRHLSDDSGGTEGRSPRREGKHSRSAGEHPARSERRHEPWPSRRNHITRDRTRHGTSLGRASTRAVRGAERSRRPSPPRPPRCRQVPHLTTRRARSRTMHRSRSPSCARSRRNRAAWADPRGP